MHIEDIIRENGVYVSTTAGISMYPMLRNRRDTIVIRPVKGRLKRYDVPLYRRGEDYVLHRIVKVERDGYTICGDNCIAKEYGIRDEQIIGVLDQFFRDGKQVDMNGWKYRMYTRVWVACYPVRRVCMRIVFAVGRRVKRLRSEKI